MTTAPPTVHRAVARTATIAVLATVASACSQERLFEPTQTGHVVQITSVRASPAILSCRMGGTTIVEVLIRLVNTTATDIHVTHASSSATVQSAGNSADVGRQLYMFSSLPYTPEGALVRATDGNVEIRVNLPAACIPGNGETEILTTVYLDTEAGRHATVPFVLRLTYQ